MVGNVLPFRIAAIVAVFNDCVKCFYLIRLPGKSGAAYKYSGRICYTYTYIGSKFNFKFNTENGRISHLREDSNDETDHIFSTGIYFIPDVRASASDGVGARTVQHFPFPDRHGQGDSERNAGTTR